MKSSEQIDKLIAHQAAEWTEKLARGDERDMAEFARWSQKSSQHMRQFLMMMALEQELTQIDPGKKIEMPSARASASARRSTVQASRRNWAMPEGSRSAGPGTVRGPVDAYGLPSSTAAASPTDSKT